jgi:hypothetical protein
MKLIGQGWQYKVYDLGNGRVRKVEQNQIRRFLRIMKSPDYSISDGIRYLLKTNKTGPIAIQGFKSLIHKIDLSKFGNPEIKDGMTYEQDWVMPLEVFFSTHSTTESKKIIAQCLDLLIYMWKFGFADIVYNFTINNGVTKDGKLILLDIGEICFDKQRAKNSVASKKWLGEWSYRTFPEGELKDYYRTTMDALTVDEFDRNWATLL